MGLGGGVGDGDEGAGVARQATAQLALLHAPLPRGHRLKML